MQWKILPLLIALVPGLVLAGPVDVNTADAETLARELNGVGAAKARAIVEYREKNGAFLSADELLNVSGIGDSLLEANRVNILVSKPQP